MTSSHNINNSTIIQLLMFGRSNKHIRDKYGLNTHHITVLMGCYLYSIYVRDKMSISGLRSFISYYSLHRLRGYLNRLVSNDLLTLSGRHYSLTSEGYQAINDICIQYNNVIYQFCNKYNIDL